MEKQEGKVSWKSPSNIALVKYWGKHGNQLPNNPSISLTLNSAFSRTSIVYRPRTSMEKGVSLSFLFEGKNNVEFATRIRRYFTDIGSYLKCLHKFHFDIESFNSFPHSAGIASSASAFSAIALALCDIETRTSGGESDPKALLRHSSEIARLGSGSACRSIYPRAALWGTISSMVESNDQYAIPMEDHVHKIFHSYRDAILIVNREEKSVSSSAGHILMEKHPYANVRYQEAKKNLDEILMALKSGDVERVGVISEMEAMQLHALMLCSNPNFILMQPDTLKIIDKIKVFRLESDVPVYFTLDAGPNVHLLYPDEFRKQVTDFITSCLTEHCQAGEWINDQVGEGPEKLE
jgi:diphosphomevalonate decarboxylase